jgi:hypothetical protein
MSLRAFFAKQSPNHGLLLLRRQETPPRNNNLKHKNPEEVFFGANGQRQRAPQRGETRRAFTFSHPDYTVGVGFGPTRALSWVTIPITPDTARGLERDALLPPIGNCTLPRRFILLIRV